MATKHIRFRNRDRLPFNFVDGILVKGIDIGNIGELTLPTGAASIGFTPTGNITATDVQGAIAQIASGVVTSAQTATQQEVNAGVNNTKAVTPLTLDHKLKLQSFTKQYIDIIPSITANVPYTVIHNLGLIDRNAFVLNTMHSNGSVRLGIESIDVNTLTLTSLVSLQNVFVIVIGATNPNQEVIEEDIFSVNLLDLNNSVGFYDLMTATGSVDLNV